MYKPIKYFFITIFSIPIIGAVWFVISITVPTYLRLYQIDSFEQTTGKLNILEIKSEYILKTNTTHYFIKKASYSYAVKGKTYSGDSVYLNFNRNNPLSIELMLLLKQKYHQDKPIIVYYDPLKPQIALLNRDIPYRYMLIITLLPLGLFFLFVYIVRVIYSEREL